MDKDIYIYHKDWNEICLVKDNLIFRGNNSNDNGEYIYNNNELIIKWYNWNDETFIHINDIYIEKNYFQNITIIYLLTCNEKNILLYDNSKNCFIKNYSINVLEKTIKFNNKIYIKFLENLYIYELDYDYFFYIETVNFNKKIKYILNKSNNIFFEYENMKNEGNYSSDNNILYLKWKNGLEKKFLSNIYYEENTLNYENIKILKPNNFIINSRVLFSNITLIKNKIYLTSVYYHNKPWNLEKITFSIENNIINKKDVIEYKNYESCIIIILELEKTNNINNLKITYESDEKIFNLKQINLPKNNLYAMTLFKDDYQLLKKYLEYYKNLGVDCFFIYYNDEINDEFINEINIINQSKYQIILMEWNYDYWYINSNANNIPKHHHSQTMAINDSLYILKNFCKYILYNDLDEYIKFEKDYQNFNELINKNENIDIFQFKCMFCKMGKDLIKYRNFYFEYDENKIIKGNFWDKYREKNLIKVDNINLMGVHNIVEQYCKKKSRILYITHFFHYVNFYEKNREELMTKYIS